MHAKLEELIIKAKEKFDSSAVIFFNIDRAWFPNEPYAATILWFYPHETIREFHGTSFGQALTKLEDFING